MPVLLFHWMLEVIDRLILQSSTCVSCIFVSRSTRLLSLRSGNQWSWYSRVHCATAKAQTLLRDTSAILVAKQPPSVSNCQKFSYKYLNWPWSKRIGFSHFKTWLLPWFSVVFPWFFLRFPMVFPSHFAPKDLATYDLVHLRRHGLDGLAGAKGETAMAEPWRSALRLCIRMDQVGSVGSAGSLVLGDHPFKALVVLGLNSDLDGVFIDVLPWLPWEYGDVGGVGYG